MTKTQMFSVVSVRKDGGHDTGSFHTPTSALKFISSAMAAGRHFRGFVMIGPDFRTVRFNETGLIDDVNEVATYAEWSKPM